MFFRVAWYNFNDVSEVLAASIIRTMMIKAGSTSETLVNLYQTTWHIPENSHINRELVYYKLNLYA
jgi:Mg2+/Co2+ transporter CorB